MSTVFSRDLMLGMLRKGQTGDQILQILSVIVPETPETPESFESDSEAILSV
jgi:hypothetical protein